MKKRGGLLRSRSRFEGREGEWRFEVGKISGRRVDVMRKAGLGDLEMLVKNGGRVCFLFVD